MSTHKYLDSTGLGQVWGKIKDYADDAKTMVVTISMPTSGEYSFNKTFTEIYNHINNGGTAIAYTNYYYDANDNSPYYVTYFGTDGIVFNQLRVNYYDWDNDSENEIVYVIDSFAIDNTSTVVHLYPLINGAIPNASSTTPLMDGTASIGSEFKYARGDHVHPSELFVVNVTSTTSNGTTTYSADKTFAEITAAVEAGKQVTAINNNYVYYYTWKNNSDIIFHSKSLTLFSSTSQITNRTFRIHNDEVVSLYTNTFQNKLTFDSTPTENSTNPVTSGGVYTALANAGSTPDWNENDSTSDAYIANRTHYKVSLGNGLNIDLLDSVNSVGTSENSYTDESTNITYNYLTNNSIYLHFHSDYNNYFPNYIDDIDITVTETIAIIDGIKHTLTLYTEYPFISYYDNTISFWLYDTTVYDDFMNSNVDTIGIDIGLNTIPTTSFSLSIPILQEQFEWHKLDNNYLNGSLIVSGDGKYSEIYNGYPEADSHGMRSKLADGDYSHVEGEGSIQEITFNISGEANVTTYHITNLYPYRAEFKDLTNSELYILNSSSGEYEASGVYITGIPFDLVGDFTDEFTFSETLDANNDYSGVGKLYVTDSKASGRASHSEGKANQALGSYSHAEGYNNVSYADYSHAEGYNTVAQGLDSHVEGDSTLARGDVSHAEGSYTYALGNCSHAEGGSSRAIGSHSHVEGYDNIAQASYSHAEGLKAIARGSCSHAEGSGSYMSFRLWLTGDANATTYTVTNFTNIYGMHPKALIGLTISDILITGVTYTNNTPSTITLESTLSTSSISNKSYYTSGNSNIASGESAHVQNTSNRAYGNGSHSEGYLNVAHAYYTHAEGVGTIASSQNQHVQGKYNIEDTSSTYSHIVGNGTASARSNAHTLDWNGNGWYAGKVSAGTVANPANPTAANDLATKKYVDDTTASITDEKLSTGTIGSGVYYPIVGTNTASATTKYIDSTGFKYDATSSTNGYARLYLGNGTASGTEGSKYGRLMIYGTTAYAVTLDSGSPTENRDISLPNKNGTIALTSDVPTKVSDLTDTTITSPTNGQVLMYNSTTSKWENTSLPIYNGGVSS